MNPITLHNAAEAVHPNGNATYAALADILKGQPLKLGTGGVTPTTAATDAAIGIALDDADAGDIVPVAILGCFTGTVLLRAAGEIDPGAQIAADGAETSGATDAVIGRALDAAAAAGDLINIAHQVAQVK